MTRKMKDSGVEWIGEIPEDWEVVKLKNISRIMTGNTPSMSNEGYYSNSNGVPWIKPDNLLEFDGVSDAKLKLTESGKVQGRIVPKDTMLICAIGSIGKFGYTTEDSAFNQQINAILFNSKVLKKYGLYYMSVQKEQQKYYGNGNVVQILNASNQGMIYFTLPLIEEQKVIADFLDKKTQEIDNIIYKTKKAIEEYKKYKQSLITETVTKGLDKNVEMKDSGIEWIGEIPEHWDVVKFKRLFRILNGKEIKNELNRNSENAIKVYGSGGVFKYTDDFLHNKTSILFGRKGTIGKPVIAEGKFWTVDTMYYTDIIHGNLKYIYYMLKAFPWEIITTQTALPSITSTDLLNKYMSVAPFKEQEQIASYLDKKCSQIDQIISTKEKLLTEMEAYKKSLIYETVTGKREVE